jgi:hypothetical protein
MQLVDILVSIIGNIWKTLTDPVNWMSKVTNQKNTVALYTAWNKNESYKYLEVIWRQAYRIQWSAADTEEEREDTRLPASWPTFEKGRF